MHWPMRILKIIAISCFLILLSTNSAFAADVLIKGKIIDAKEQPVGLSSIKFINQQGQSVADTSTDSNGAYSVIISQGTYTIEASGPADSKFKTTTLKDQALNSDTDKNIILSTGSLPAIGSLPWIPILIVAAIIVVIIIFFAVRRRGSSL